MTTKAIPLAKLPPIGSTQPSVGLGISPRAVKQYEGLQGPSYQLNAISDSTKHKLPQPQVLRPFVDTKAGSLDTWPAHATAQATSKPGIPSHRPRSSPDSRISAEPSEDPQRSIIPKPRFLEQLEMFLKKELRNLDGNKEGPSELRLLAYREVFEYLIEDFKTYKPLLSSIKTEYEMMLAHQREQIRELEPLKSMLVTVSEQCDQKVMAMREEERQEMLDLKKDKKVLQERIYAMKQHEVSLQMQIDKLQEEVAAEYYKYRNECDARKLLVADINDLRYQQEDYQKSQGQVNQAGETKEDPIKLKIALRKAREDLTDATQRLTEMIANYGDVVPRRDFEGLKVQHEKLQEEMTTLKNDHDILMSEHDTLLEVNKQVLSQRDEFYSELEVLKRSATPRPDWDRCASFMEGGEERWKTISMDKSSDYKVELLLKELAGEGEGLAFFEPKGTGEDVPIYLRSDIKVRNREYSKDTALELIKEIWKAKNKQESEKEDGAAEPMDVFVVKFLDEMYRDKKMIAEKVYNLNDACERYQDVEGMCGLFFQVLKNEVNEQVYNQQMEMLEQLMEALNKASETVHIQTSTLAAEEEPPLEAQEGEEMAIEEMEEDISIQVISRENFEAALREVFTVKTDENIEELMVAVVDDLKPEEGEETLKFQDIFMEVSQPDWDRCASFMEGGEERWKTISMDKSSDYKVELLLKELAGEGEGLAFFEPKGTGEDVPIYLRSDIKVRNREYSKDTALELIKEIWKAKNKQESEKEDGAAEPMDVFVVKFLDEMYRDKKMIAEKVYNLNDACERYQDVEGMCGLFFQVLKNEVNEQVYNQQMEMLEQLMEALNKASETVHIQTSTLAAEEEPPLEAQEGEEMAIEEMEEDISIQVISRENFEAALREVFTVKTDENIEELMVAVVDDLKPEEGEETLKFQDIFMEDEDGGARPFINLIRQQDKEERQKYVEQIKMELGDREEVPLPDLRMAINVVDAEIDKNHMTEYLARSFDVPNDQLSTATPTPIETVVKRLLKAGVRRIGVVNSSEL